MAGNAPATKPKAARIDWIKRMPSGETSVERDKSPMERPVCHPDRPVQEVDRFHPGWHPDPPRRAVICPAPDCGATWTPVPKE